MGEGKDEGGSGTCNRVDNGIYGRRDVMGVVLKGEVEQGRDNFCPSSRNLQDNDFYMHPLGQWQGCLWNEDNLEVRTNGGVEDEDSLRLKE